MDLRSQERSLILEQAKNFGFSLLASLDLAFDGGIELLFEIGDLLVLGVGCLILGLAIFFDLFVKLAQL